MKQKIRKVKNVTALLLESVARVGQAGEVKQLKPGFYRFLAQKNKAMLVTRQNLPKLEEMKLLAEKRIAVGRQGAENLKERIEGLVFRTRLTVGEHNEIYGSVNKQEIRDYLKQEGIEVGKGQIELEQPIRELGEHSATINLGYSTTATLKIVVEPK